MNKKDKRQNYSDLFFYYQFDDDCLCKHQFMCHALVYVYYGELEINGPDQTITVKSGKAAFVCKDTSLQISVYCKNSSEAKIAILRIPENFLHEFYFTTEKQKHIPITPDRSSFLIPQREDVDSLFCSMQPYYGTNVIPGEKILKLKIIEAIYALLETDWTFYSLLFGFAYSGKLDVLDLLVDTSLSPFYWQRCRKRHFEPSNKIN